MNLISCETCGVVLDKNRLTFPNLDKILDSEENITWVWNGKWLRNAPTHIPIIPCPVCGCKIPKSTEKDWL